MIGFKVMFTGLLIAMSSAVIGMLFSLDPRQSKGKICAAIFLAGFFVAFIGAIWQILS